MTKKQVMIWRIILLLIIFVSIGSYFILIHKEKDEIINDVKVDNVEVTKTVEESDLKENKLKEKKSLYPPHPGIKKSCRAMKQA